MCPMLALRSHCFSCSIVPWYSRIPKDVHGSQGGCAIPLCILSYYPLIRTPHMMPIKLNVDYSNVENKIAMLKIPPHESKIYHNAHM